MNRWLRLLGVEPTEERSVALMSAHAFFMGAATVFFETAVAAFFLARFDTRHLPWVYVAAAVVNMVTGTLYAKVQQKVRFSRLMSGTLWFLLVTVLAFRFGLGVSTAAWLAFGGLVGYRVLSILTDLEYWAVAARVYDVRQAKRLFGLIGTGEVIARIVGAFSVPFLVSIGGVANLIVLAAVALAACLVFLRMTLRGARHADEVSSKVQPEGANANAARGGLGRIFESRYLTLVVALAIFATFGKYFVDFAFLKQMATRTKDEAQLASLLGLINGATQVLSLLTRLFISRPLLHRFGIRLGLLVLPGLHLLCTFGILLTSAFGGEAALVFWFAVANQGVYDTFKHPIDNPSFKVLYQPLRRDERLVTQIAVEAVVNPMVIGVAGVVMLLFATVLQYSPGKFALVLAANFLCWLALGRMAGKGYVTALVAMLQGHSDAAERLTLDDATTRTVLEARLKSGAPIEVCFALRLLERANADNVVEVLVQHARHPEAEVRRYAIERLTDLDPTALWPIRHRLSADPAASVRSSAMRAITANRGEDIVSELLPHLEDEDRVVRRAVVAHLLELADEVATAAAQQHIAVWAKCAAAADRCLAARLAGEHGLPEIVRSLVDDETPAVRRAALAAAGRLKDPAFRDTLFLQLDDRRFAETAARALALHGESVLAEVQRRWLQTAPRIRLARLAWVCALVGGDRASAILCGSLDEADVVVRGAVLFALDKLRFHATDTIEVRLRELVRDEVAHVAWALAVHRDLEADEPLGELRRALEVEVRWARRRILYALPALYDRTAVVRAREHLEHPSQEKRAYALEVLDLTLDAEMRDHVLPILDARASTQLLGRLEELFPQPAKTANARIVEIAERSVRRERPWTRVLALQACAERRLLDRRAFEPWLSAPDALTRELARWSLEELRITSPEEARQTTPNSTKHGERTMLLIEKIILLKGVPMFADASEEALAEIASAVEEVDYQAGRKIFDKGDTGDSMYVVVSGRVRVFDGNRTLSMLGEREIFGELALLDPEPRSASVEAMEDSRLFRLDDDTFSQLMAGNLEMLRGVLHVLCTRLRRTSADAVIG